MLPTLTILGRTNVGKSTLFNRLIEKNKAIVSKMPGTTRDRNYGTIIWRGLYLRIIDTGGLDIARPKDSIEKQILEQTKSAIKQADILLLIVDAQTGIVPDDRTFMLLLRETKIPKLVIANKADSFRERQAVWQFLKLGLGKPIAISAKKGIGIGDLLDKIFQIIKPGSELPAHGGACTIVIIGKPNVGKSSLLNAIVGEKRVIVSEIPQTTREPQEALFTQKSQTFQIIDTAGLKKKAKTHPGIERIASKKTYETIEQADIILFVLDISQPITRQDRVLAGLIKSRRVRTILIANKWDEVNNKQLTTDNIQLQKKYILYIKKHLPPFSKIDVPVLFVSAKTGQNVKKILELLIRPLAK